MVFEIENARASKSSSSTPSADAIIRCWIVVAKELVKLNNWHSLQGILAGLQISLTKENKAIWAKVPNEVRPFNVKIR